MTSDMEYGFREALSEYLAEDIPRESDFYSRICKVYDIFERVRSESDGHGITFLIRRDEEPGRLDKHMRNARPYNGMIHNVDDEDIENVVAEKRQRDLATVVDSYGDIIGAGLYLPADDVAYQEKYGIECDLGSFMGFKPDEEGQGGRSISSLCASDLMGESVAIITLGETTHEGKGNINLYYCGDRIYNSAGKRMRWDWAKTLPAHRQNKTDTGLRTVTEQNEEYRVAA